MLDASFRSRRRCNSGSEDCKLRTRMSAGDQDGGEWFTVAKPTLFLNGAGNATAINVTFLEQGSTYFQFLMKMGHESHMKEVAKLKVTCNPEHMLNSWVSMSQKDGIRFVNGQVGGNSFHEEERQVSASFAEKDATQRNLKDEDFMSKKPWTELGGTKAAASYLQSSDETGLALLSLRPCTDADKMEAPAICAKHFHSFDFMDHSSEVLQNALADCVSDICSARRARRRRSCRNLEKLSLGDF